jgi:hypothetical protein
MTILRTMAVNRVCSFFALLPSRFLLCYQDSILPRTGDTRAAASEPNIENKSLPVALPAFAFCQLAKRLANQAQ